MLGILWYRHSTAMERQTAELMSENQQLHAKWSNRLTDEHRVAEMLMTDQKLVNVEFRRRRFCLWSMRGINPTLPPKIFTIQGNQVHLDAMVIKFERDFVKAERSAAGA